MKRIILSTVITGFLFTACQKEDMNPGNATGTQSKNNPPVTVQSISPVPATFVKKILAEEFVSTTVGLSPDAALDLDAVSKTYPDIVYPASLHVDDIMSSNAGSHALKLLATQPMTFPLGLVSRKPFNGNLFLDTKQMDAAVQWIINKPVDCGLAISTNVVGAVARLDIHAGFTATMSNTLEVHTYLVEDGIITSNPDFEQENSLNTTPGNHYYGAGNPIHNFEHRNVVRRLLCANSISTANQVAGGEEVFTNWVDIPAVFSGTSNFKILSFIIDTNTNEVLNVQQCALGQEKDWN